MARHRIVVSLKKWWAMPTLRFPRMFPQQKITNVIFPCPHPLPLSQKERGEICNTSGVTLHFAGSFVVLTVLLLIAGCGGRGAQSASEGDENSSEGRALSVRTTPAQRRTIAETIDGLGTCEALLDKTAVVAPAMEGRVLDIIIKLGDAVKAGQPIVRLDPKLAEANLREKISTCDGLKDSLRLLKSLPRPEEQKSSRLAIEEADIALQKAESVVERLRPLRQRNEIPQQQMFEAELAVKQARLAKNKAENQLEVLLLGPRAEAVDEANAHVVAAEAEVALARSQLELLTLRSPIDGVAERITCKLGQTLAAGSPVGEVVDARQLEALIWLPTFHAASVRVGQAAEVFSADSPRKNENSRRDPVPGKVTFVGRVADPQTGSLPVRILIDNPQSRFTLGQTITAAITVREKADALAVPVGALDDLGAGPQLNAVRKGKTAVLHPNLGMKDKHWVEILETDLKPGEPVIVEGGYNLPEGIKVSCEDVSKTDKQNGTEERAGAAPTP
jgi:HlyD family secretion protein